MNYRLEQDLFIPNCVSFSLQTPISLCTCKCQRQLIVLLVPNIKDTLQHQRRHFSRMNSLERLQKKWRLCYKTTHHKMNVITIFGQPSVSKWTDIAGNNSRGACHSKVCGFLNNAVTKWQRWHFIHKDDIAREMHVLEMYPKYLKCSCHQTLSWFKRYTCIFLWLYQTYSISCRYLLWQREVLNLVLHCNSYINL